MTIYAAELGGWVDPADAFIQFFAKSTNSFWFDRAFSNASSITFMGAGQLIDSKSANELLSDSAATKLFENIDPGLLPEFIGGLVGYITFEGEQRWLRVDRAIFFNHDSKKLVFLADVGSEDEFKHWQHAAYLRLALVGGEQVRYRLENPIPLPTSIRVRHSRADYLGRISAAIENIQLGNVYQLCLTNEISLETDADPLAVFLGMRHQTRAPYSAFLRIESITLVSASPELFLKVSASGGLLTKPIKGTRARSVDAETDQMIAQELQTNEKERAENLMIVDLMRNDFARVAKPDSVSVDGLFQVESYQTVHQLVSTVSAQLAPEFDAFDAIAATFPGGSMTGAPKPMAIKLIRRLESGQRGVYSGVFGWIASTGTTELAMTIRTIVFQSGTAKIGVGGGITLDSDPEAEFEEIRLKASALLSALSAVDPW